MMLLSPYVRTRVVCLACFGPWELGSSVSVPAFWTGGFSSMMSMAMIVQ